LILENLRGKLQTFQCTSFKTWDVDQTVPITREAPFRVIVATVTAQRASPGVGPI
jgi:hypothetical protein